MNVPRPLLVVVVVIIVLGVVACGAGVIRGRMENGDPSPSPTDRFDGFGNTEIRRRDVTFTGNCGSDSNTPLVVSIGSSCQTTIEPQALRPRKLKVKVGGGDVDVFVRQRIRGENRDQSGPVDDGDDVEVAIAGTDPVMIFFSCTCTLTFSE